jgi:hypothetical protein
MRSDDRPHRRPGGRAARLARAVLALSLLSALVACGDGGITVDAVLSGLSAEARALRVEARLGADRLVEPVWVDPPQFAVRLPSTARGVLQLAVQEIDGQGCPGASGHGELDIYRARHYTVGVALAAPSPATGCGGAAATIEVRVSGLTGQARALAVRPSLGAMPSSSRLLILEGRERFPLLLPAATRGTLRLDVSEVLGGGCTGAAGSGALLLPGTAGSYPLDVGLRPMDPECPQAPPPELAHAP